MSLFNSMILASVHIFIFSTLITDIDSRKVSRHYKYTDEYNMNDDECECGKSHFPPEAVNLVVNGVVVTPYNKYPWMVGIIDEHRHRICGGVMLSENYVMSAAHCFGKDPVTEDFKISFFSKYDDRRVLSQVEKLIIHPDFYKVAHDIALVKLTKPRKCDEYVSPICLPPDGFDVPVGNIYHIAGWGKTNVVKRVKDMLEGGLEIVDMDVCSSSKNYKYFKDSAYCCKGAYRSGPCYGDSGGPMFKMYADKFFTFGVTTSHSDQVCSPEKQFVYTSVPLHMKWIEENTDLKSTTITEEMSNMQAFCLVTK